MPARLWVKGDGTIITDPAREYIDGLSGLNRHGAFVTEAAVLNAAAGGSHTGFMRAYTSPNSSTSAPRCGSVHPSEHRASDRFRRRMVNESPAGSDTLRFSPATSVSITAAANNLD